MISIRIKITINIKFRKFDECWTNNSLKFYTAYKSGTTIYKTQGEYFNHTTDVGKVFYWPDGSSDIIQGV